MTNIQQIIDRRLTEERDGLAEAEVCLAEQRGRVALLSELRAEIEDEPAPAVQPDILFQGSNDDARIPMAHARFALQVYAELIKQTTFNETVHDWIEIGPGNLHDLRTWVLNEAWYFAEVWRETSPDALSLVDWERHIIPAIIARCDFRIPNPTTPPMDEIRRAIDAMVADAAAAIYRKSGG